MSLCTQVQQENEVRYLCRYYYLLFTVYEVQLPISSRYLVNLGDLSPCVKESTTYPWSCASPAPSHAVGHCAILMPYIESSLPRGCVGKKKKLVAPLYARSWAVFSTSVWCSLTVRMVPTPHGLARKTAAVRPPTFSPPIIIIVTTLLLLLNHAHLVAGHLTQCYSHSQSDSISKPCNPDAEASACCTDGYGTASDPLEEKSLQHALMDMSL